MEKSTQFFTIIKYHKKVLNLFVYQYFDRFCFQNRQKLLSYRENFDEENSDNENSDEKNLDEENSDNENSDEKKLDEENSDEKN